MFIWFTNGVEVCSTVDFQFLLPASDRGGGALDVAGDELDVGECDSEMRRTCDGVALYASHTQGTSELFNGVSSVGKRSLTV